MEVDEAEVDENVHRKRSHSPEHPRILAKKSKRRTTNNNGIIGEDADDTLGNIPTQKTQRINEVPGRIASIDMENFMCHTKLKVVFDVDNCNCFYIGGPNGSGKSALFAALNIGLGGKGSQNDRGNSLKQYIKEGQTRARIKIVLTNVGQGAMEEYGSRIVVERTIGATGSGYVLRSISGQGRDAKEEVVSKKKGDLDRIRTRFGIQLENPIFWMSQDRCRQFLQDMKPDRLFAIFSKATELEYTEAAYEHTQIILVDIERGLEEITERMALSQEEFDKLIKEHGEHAVLQVQRAKADALSWYLIWGPVKNAYREKKLTLEKIDATDGQIKKIASSILETREEHAHLNKLQAEELEGLEDLREQITMVNDQVSDKMEARTTLKKNLGTVSQQKRALVTEIDLKRRNLVRAEQKLKDHRLQSNIDKKRKDHKRAKEDLQINEEKMATLTREKTEFEHEKADAEKEEEEMRKKMEVIRREQQTLVGRRNELTREKDRLTRSAEDALLRFGPRTKNILQLIEQNAHRFRVKPVGPVGMHVKVREDKWAFAADRAIKSVMCDFLVDNGQDDKLLRSLLTQNKIPLITTKIWVTKFVRRHDTSRNAPASNLVTVERMLDVDNDAAYNVLVDRCAIETILLIESDREARQLMDGRCPQNARKCYTTSGAMVNGSDGRSGFYRFFPDNSQRKVAEYLVSTRNDPAEAIDEVEHTLRECSARLSEVERKIPELIRNLRLAEGMKKDIDGKLANNSRSKRMCEEALRTLRIKMESFEDDDEMAKMEDSLQASVAENVQEIEKLEKDKEPFEEQIEYLNTEMEEAQASIAELKARVVALQRQIEPLQQKYNDTSEGVGRSLKKIDILEKNEEDIKKRAVALEEDRLRFSHAFEDLEKKAIADCEHLITPPNQHIPPDMDALPDHSRTTAQWNHIVRSIEAVEKTIRPLDVVQELLRSRKRKMREELEIEKRLVKVFKAIREAIGIRKQKFPVMRAAITHRMKSSFVKLMKSRNFQGEIDISFRRRTIDITVKTHKQDEKTGVTTQTVIQDLKGLSGGERSFTTACFVMSLWEIMESPFRCMDEFDVFMDMCNRKIVMDLLIHYATKCYSYSQFLMFTPQGIKELEKNDRVQVFEMPKVRDGVAGGTIEGTRG